MSLLDREILALMRKVTDHTIMPYYQALSRGQITDKSPGDVVTVADHAAEEMLAEGLAALNPGIAIVGEEGAHADPAVLDLLSGPCWIIDPVDGTNNFAAGRPPFGILLALADRGVAQSGWIYDCLSGRFCAAHKGGGASIDGEQFTARTSGQTPPVGAISTVYMDPAKREAVKRHIAPHYAIVDIPRCAAEQYPRLGLGINDVSIFERTLAWDHAAGTLWLNEAGGKAARPDGSPYRVDEHGRIGLIGAATPQLFEQLAERLNALDYHPA